MDSSRPPPIGFELQNDPSQGRLVRLKMDMHDTRPRSARAG